MTGVQTCALPILHGGVVLVAVEALTAADRHVDVALEPLGAGQALTLAEDLDLGRAEADE